MYKHRSLLNGILGIKNDISYFRVDSPVSYYESTDSAEKSEVLTKYCSVADNVFIDETGAAKRRQSVDHVYGESVHSLFSSESLRFMYFVSDTMLCAIDVYGNVHEIFGPIIGDISYSVVNDNVYYMNMSCFGRLSGLSHEIGWGPTIFDRDTSLATYSRAPYGDIICNYKGRMFVASGNVLYFSEPLFYSCFNVSDSYILYEDNITLLFPVENGIYVSTKNNIYFLIVDDSGDFAQKNIQAPPALFTRTASCVVDTRFDGSSGDNFGAAWVTASGMCIGNESGLIKNITIENVFFDKDIKLYNTSSFISKIQDGVVGAIITT